MRAKDVCREIDEAKLRVKAVIMEMERQGTKFTPQERKLALGKCGRLAEEIFNLVTRIK